MQELKGMTEEVLYEAFRTKAVRRQSDCLEESTPPIHYFSLAPRWRPRSKPDEERPSQVAEDCCETVLF